MPDQAYYDGDFYDCVVATAAGESPASAPTSWHRIQIPKDFRWVLSRLTYAHLLEMDGQKDKANAERAVALGADRMGLEAMLRKEANRQRHDRPNVQTRC